MAPSDPDPRPWSITKAEFDGWLAKYEPSRGAAVVRFVVCGLIVGVGVAFALYWERPISRILGPLFALLAIVMVVRSWRNLRRMHRAGGLIWAEGGAVCPKCRAALGDSACAHGLTREDAETTRAYWEAAARTDIAAVNLAVARLAGREATGGAFGRPLAAWKRARRWSAAAVFDADKPIWKRLLAAILGFGLTMGVFMTVSDWAIRGIAPTPLDFAFKTLQFGLTFGGMMMAIVAWTGTRPGRNHCVACGHLVAAGHETRPCSECGADLTKAGAIGSGERRRDARTAVVGGVVAIAAFLAPMVVGSSLFAGVMPTRVLMLQYAIGDDVTRFGVTRELSQRTLDAATSAAVADMLIDAASLEPDEPLADSSFVGAALIAGNIGADTAARALRASVAVRLEAPERVRAGEPFEMTVRPSFGSDLFQLTHLTAVTWAGIEAHGEAAPAATRFFTERDFDPTRLPELRAMPATLTLASPGEHRLRVRAWVALLPLAPLPKPSFDDDGQLIAPPGTAAVFELVAETTVVAE